MRIVELVSKCGSWLAVVSLWATVIILLWIIWKLGWCLHRRSKRSIMVLLVRLGLLVLLIDQFLIPHFLLAHLLAHFVLQISYFLLQALLNLLFDDSSN